MSGEQDFLDEFTEDESTSFEINEVNDSGSGELRDGPTQADGRARGADGKFIKKEAEDVAERVEMGVKDDVEGPPPDSAETMVPVSVVQALREEIKGLKAKSEPKPKAPEFNTPQPNDYDDPNTVVQNQLHQQKMQMSTFMATQENDQDTVNQAWDAFDKACQSDPTASALSYRLVNHPHPMGEVVRWYKQQNEVKMLQDAGGLDALVEAKLKEFLSKQDEVPVPEANQQSTTPRPPPSLAKRGGGSQSESIVSETDDFDAFFKR